MNVTILAVIDLLCDQTDFIVILAIVSVIICFQGIVFYQ